MPATDRVSLALNGINAATGRPLLAPPTLEQIAAFACGERWNAAEIEELRRRRDHRREEHLDLGFRIDLRRLEEAGWGVVFSADGSDEIREALAPLLALRRAQAGEAGRYRELVHRRGETKGAFLARHGVGPGPVDPDRLPFYLLLAADPEDVPFRFQYQLDVQFAVGRLSFPTAEEYARYADSVVAAEMATRSTSGRVSFFGVANPDDRATALATERLVEPLAACMKRSWPRWPIEAVTGIAATKAALAERLGGARTPALLFTAGHGVGFEADDDRQLTHQGALLCQDWPGPLAWEGPIPPEHYLAADDVSDAASPAGLIAFFFACYGAGTPHLDSFSKGGAAPSRIAPESFVARLPQRLLGHRHGGALAVVGHVDRAWTCSFDWPAAGEQHQVFASALGRLLDGYPVGAAMEYFNQRYAELASDLTHLIEEANWGARPDLAQLASLWTANNDARSYVVLGDPAVRLSAIEPPEGQGTTG